MVPMNSPLNAALKALANDVRLKAPLAPTGPTKLAPQERLRRIQRIVTLADEVEQLAEIPDPRAEEQFEAILRELGRAGAFPDGSLVIAAAFAF